MQLILQSWISSSYVPISLYNVAKFCLLHISSMHMISRSFLSCQMTKNDYSTS